MSERIMTGHHLRGILNDLKRRPADAALELGVSEAEMQDLLEERVEIPFELVLRAVEIWPMSLRDFLPMLDDNPKGLRVMRASESVESARVMDRAGKPYYEYRDTAMSAVAPFRPEWIKELCEVTTDDPEDQAIQWNNGHFMHQFTYFVGPVNFYHRGRDGQKQVAVMNTGDSMYITPFVPHSFAVRSTKAREPGCILALTYGDKLAGDARQELSTLGVEQREAYVLDLSAPERAAARLLEFHREALSMSHEELQRRSAISATRLGELRAGVRAATRAELNALAAALGVDSRELHPPNEVEEPVVVRHYAECPSWTYPDGISRYRMVELASTHHLAHSKSLEVNVLDSELRELDLRAGLHQYGYVVGDRPLEVHWTIESQAFSERLHPGDSFCMKPFVPHAFAGDGATVLTLRVGGRMAGDPMRELSRIDAAGRERVAAETVQWFDPAGRNRIDEP